MTMKVKDLSTFKYSIFSWISGEEGLSEESEHFSGSGGKSTVTPRPIISIKLVSFASSQILLHCDIA